MYSIVNTKEFVFLSAYLTRKIQFNDVDKDKLKSHMIENNVSENVSSEQTIPLEE